MYGHGERIKKSIFYEIFPKNEGLRGVLDHWTRGTEKGRKEIPELRIPLINGLGDY